MKRRLCLCLGWLSGPGLVVALSAYPGPALAQSLGSAGTGIPTAVKNAAEAGPYQNQIRTFAQQRVLEIVGPDTEKQRIAKNSLLNECTATSSASYIDVYGTEVNAAVVAALSKKLPLRARLNLAVVVEGVARVGHTNRIEPAVIQLLSDPAAPVSLWGAKAAAPVIVVLIQNPNLLLSGDKLLAALPAAVAQHPKAGYVAEAAYQSLIPVITGMGAKQIDALVPPLITPMLDVLQIRVSLYKTMVPDVPEAESGIATFLYHHYTQGEATDAEKQRTLQLLSDLISGAGQQVASASKADREQIIRMLKSMSGALTVMCGPNPALGSLLGMGPGTTAQIIAERCKAVFASLKAVAPDLIPPPVVTPAAPATAPATGVPSSL